MYVFIKLIALISKLKFLLQAETFFFFKDDLWCRIKAGMSSLGFTGSFQ